MKILIVDDQPKRYDRLVEAFRELDIEREQIEIAVSAMDARDRIDEQLYDLMILDILLPLRPEDEVSVQNAIDLLFEIQETELPNAPRHILGITADRAVSKDALHRFEDWCWTILDYSVSSDEWITRATNCVRYVREKALEGISASQRTDLAIVCALGTPELSEILKLPWNWGVSRPIDDLRFVQDGFVDVDGRRITVCATAAPRMGMVATALHSAAVITHLRPQMLAMTGICAGVQGKARMGDILFADTAWDCQNGKRHLEKNSAEIRLAHRPHHLPADPKVRSHIEQIRDDKVGLVKMVADYHGTAPGISRVLIGPVASGSAVLADGKSVGEIREQQNDMVGVEMEIYGLYAAAHAAAGARPMTFALKGVCDFGDPEKDDEQQNFAAYASARVLQMLIERFGSRLLE
jgi:nucleoside phosphorylase/CheY-like chemotaxis protein